MLEILRNMMNFFRTEKGQTTIEYLLVLVLIVLVIVVAFRESAITSAIDQGVSAIANEIANG